MTQNTLQVTPSHRRPLRIRMAPGIALTLTLSMIMSLLAEAPVFAGSARDSVGSRTPKKSDNAEEAQEIIWRNYENGIQLAKEQGKQVLIDFFTSWCGYCKKMDRETFADAKVIDFINSNFIAIRVNGDSKREIEIEGFSTTEKKLTSEMYGVRGYPTFWFLESDGAKIGKQPGYQPARSFLELLTFVSERKYLEQSTGSGANQSQ